MKFFVISDIHGSSVALKKVLNVYKSGSYRKLIICGDILYHGARNPLPEGYNPKEIISILNEIKEELIVVKGNCESEVDSMVLEFPIKSEYSHLITDHLDVFIMHGHTILPKDAPINKGSIVLSGHTHIPTGEIENGLYLLNPGSISLPKGGFEPSFGILSDNKWEVKSLEGLESILTLEF